MKMSSLRGLWRVIGKQLHKMLPPKIIRIVVKEPKVGAVLTLEQYRSAFRQSDRPSDEQIENFVDYVANAHSWYKHLPLAPPGRTFWFYMDPVAGCDVFAQEDGSFRAKERTSERGFHYNYRNTAYWRSHFAVLQFHSNEGNNFLVPGTGTFTRSPHELPMVFMPDGKLHRIPPEMDAGTTELNGIIHGHFTRELSVLSWFLCAGRFETSASVCHEGGHRAADDERPNPYTAEWSEEYGGNSLRDLVASEVRAQPRGNRSPDSHPFLAAALERIRTNQHGKMRLAIRRARALVFGV
jgi:hypothetical protein